MFMFCFLIKQDLHGYVVRPYVLNKLITSNVRKRSEILIGTRYEMLKLMVRYTALHITVL